jgi:hypothetical protein
MARNPRFKGPESPHKMLWFPTIQSLKIGLKGRKNPLGSIYYLASIQPRYFLYLKIPTRTLAAVMPFPAIHEEFELTRKNGKIGSGSRSGEVFSFSYFYSSFFFPRYFDRKESSAAS